LNVTATSAGTNTLNFAAANYNAVNLSLNSSQFTLASGTETVTVSNNGDNTNTTAGTGTTLTLTGTLGGPGTVSLISAGTGTLNLNPGAGTTSRIDELLVNGGNLVMNSGSLNLVGSAAESFGLAGGGSFTLNGGYLSTAGSAQEEIGGDNVVGLSGSGNVVINSGTWNNMGGNQIAVGYGGGGSHSVLTINNGGLVISINILMEANNPNIGTLNLNAGGTLLTQQIYNGGSGGESTGILNLNGGTLEVLATAPFFIDFTGTNNTSTAYVQAGGAIFNTNGFNATVNNPLVSGTANDGGVTKNGLGTLTLTGSDNYNGGTTVNAGTLAITGSGTIGSGTATLNGGALDLGGKNITNIISVRGGTLQDGTATQASGSFDIESGAVTAVLTGAAGLLKTTSGTASLSGANTYGGSTLINGGVLAVSAAGTLPNTYITFGGGTLKYIGNTTDYSGQIVNSGSAVSIDTGNVGPEFYTPLAATNSGGLTVLSSSGNGTLTVIDAQVYTGLTTITSGGLYLGDNTGGDDVSSMATSGILDNGLLEFRNVSTETNTIAISGTGTVGMYGTGEEILSGSNSYSGGTQVNSGVLNYTNSYALGTGNVTFTGPGTLQAGVSGTLASSLGANPGITGTFDTQGNSVATTGGLFGAGNVAKIGSGTLTLTGTSNNTGALFLDAGTVNLGSANALSTTAGTITFKGGTLQYSSANQADYSSRIANSGSAITIDTNGQNVTWTGTLASSNTGGLIKNGSGTLTLFFPDLYTGTTIINSGTLRTGATNFAVNTDGPMIVNSGGAFDAGGINTYWISGITGSGLITSTPGTATIGINGGSQTGTFSGSMVNVGIDYRQTNSTWNLTGSSNIGSNGFSVGNVSDAQASTVNLTGTFTGGPVYIGRDGGAVFNVNGGYINTSDIRVGWGAPTDPVGHGVFNLNSGTVISPTVESTFGRTSGTSPELFNLNGGVLETAQILIDSGSNPAFTFTMNGGTLLVTNNGTIFNNGGSSTGNEVSVQIGAGGGIINTNGFNTTSVRPITDGTAGPGMLTKLGTGTLTLSNTGSWSGGTALNGGILNLNNPNALGSGGLSFGGGTLQYSSSNQVDYSSQIASSGSAISIDTNGQNVAFASSLPSSNIGGLTKLGAGQLSLSASNAYGGGTVINAGTLQTANANALGAASASLAVNGGTLDMDGNSIKVGALSGSSGTVITTTAGGTITLTASSATSTTYAGAITAGAGTLGLTQAGTGTLKLTGDNTYTGATAVNAGTLVVSGSLSGTGSASVASGGTLEVDGLLNHAATTTLNGGTLQGTGSVGGITDNGSSTVAPGLTAANSAISTGTMTANGPVTLAATTNFNIRLGFTSGTTGDQLAVNSGNVSLNDANLNLTLGSAMNNPALINTFYAIIVGGAGSTGSGSDVFGSYNGTAIVGNTFITSGGWQFNILYAENATGTGGGNDVVLELTAIPEPGTWATMLSGFGMLLFVQRMRRKGRL
jgi:autotransporter-associated beta strand protein